MINFFEEMKDLTTKLVNIESVVSRGNESKVAESIYNFYSELDYFKKNPEDLILQKTVKDQIERHNAICLLRGKDGNLKNTIVMLGHIDTVGLDDYGSIMDLATSPEELKEVLKNEDMNKSAKEDLKSGNYMFGRGAVDMKSGVAAQMLMIKYFSENLDKLNGNLLVISECDEEDSSHGIISALDALGDFKEKYDLDYLVAVNSDFTAPLYEGDKNKYIYIGTNGKLLPSFYISGVETHVGQAFSGLDPNLVAAEINTRLNYNMDYSDSAQGETTLPPVCLQLRDLKAKYDVQTANASNSFYNYITYSQGADEVLEKMKDVAVKSLDHVMSYLNNQQEKWQRLTGFSEKKIDFETQVLTWKEFRENSIKKFGDEFINFEEDLKEKLNSENPDMGITDFSLEMVDRIYKKFNTGNKSAIIIYYGSPFYQNIAITGKNERENVLIQSVENIIIKAKEYCDDNIVVKYFYPYISDSSFVYLPEEKSGISAYKENFPAWGEKYSHPIEKIEKISMPTVNIGTYGNDAHKFTERVEMNYTFKTLPNLLKDFIFEMLG